LPRSAKEIEGQQASKKKKAPRGVLSPGAAERAPLSPVPEDLRELYTRIAKRHHGRRSLAERPATASARGLRQCASLPHILQQLLQDANDETISL